MNTDHLVALRAENADLRARLSAAEDLVAVIAHELRNSIAPIRSSAALLHAQEPANPLWIRCRDVIDRQAAQMARLLDDLLEMSRLSRDGLTLQRATVILRETIDAAVDLCRPLVEQRQHTLTFDDTRAGISIEADGVRLIQVFGNLLANAAKYTPCGGRIHVSVRQEANDVVVGVRDTGPGITPDNLESIFEWFAHGDTESGHASRGLGVGLALARRLVEMHGGTLSASSAGRGRGSEFLVRLPIGQPREAAAPPPASLFAIDESWHHTRVLVADDNVDAAETLGMLFEQLGAEVRTAHDGESAAREADAFRPDVVLLDTDMPCIDGFEVCRRVRQNAPRGETLIVALSGWGREEDRRRAFEAGFDAHFLKPIDAAILLRRLRELQSRASSA